MNDAHDPSDLGDESHDDLAAVLPAISPEAILLAEEQAEDDFDFDFDDDFAEEFADEWEPATAADEVVEAIDADGAVKFVVENGADLN